MKTRSFQRYSHTSCRMECALEKALSASHCLPWYSTIHFEFQALDFRHYYKTNNEIDNFQRYLPHPPKADIKTCRSSTPLISISQVSFLPQLERDSLVPEEDEQRVRVGVRLPPGLPVHRLPILSHLRKPHVIHKICSTNYLTEENFVQTTITCEVLEGNPRHLSSTKQHNTYFRQCDSRNLNLSPLCMLDGGALPRFWMSEVAEIELL